MTDGLSAEHAAVIRRALAAGPNIRRAVLFGSRARGTFRPASDVDLALEGASLGFTDLTAILSRLADSTLAVEVDLVVRAAINNPDLEHRIQTEGREWYRRGDGE